MSKQESPIVEIEQLTIQRIRHDRVSLSGRLAQVAHHQDLVRSTFEQFHQEAVEQRLAQFEVDVRGLQFVNSSSIRIFVDWIARAASANYRMVFETDQSITWQRLTFQVLVSMSPEVVEVRESVPPSEGNLEVLGGAQS